MACFAEAAIFDEAQVSLPSGDGTRAATHGLEIEVGRATNEGRSRHHGGAHAVATGDVLGTAFGKVAVHFTNHVREVDGIEIVAT